tara:strand:- start:2300 stop:2587 length:288 start_codon:yes stop_codon:yes gene_type:complete
MEDRIEMIKAAAEKLAFRSKFRPKKKLSVSTRLRKAASYTDEKRGPKDTTDSDYSDRVINEMDDNHNHWTDSSSYVTKHYGAVSSETKKDDNDWN